MTEHKSAPDARGGRLGPLEDHHALDDIIDRIDVRHRSMFRGLSSDSADETRLVAALEEYLTIQDAAGFPGRRAFLARHAEIAGPLAECLDALAFVQSVAARPENGLPILEQDSVATSSLLGGFRILRVVGRGGMGVVYEAEQVALGRRVALKVLPFAASLDPAQRQRFQIEAQAAAHLQHPNIVPVFAVGSEGGAHFYAMQFIDGRTLDVVIRDLQLATGRTGWGDQDSLTSGGLSSSVTAPGSASNGLEQRPLWDGEASAAHGPDFSRTAARLGAQAAEALEYAHRMGVVHRDIKPANLMIDCRGNLWITDFGLARFGDEDGPTRTGEVLGTLRYMSPEQAEARRGVVDQRSDVYSLGVTLYEILTLRPALDGAGRQEILRQLAQDDPPAPRSVEPSVPRDLETIVMKAIDKEPARRYATAAELAEDLRRFLDDRPILARRPTPRERLARWTRRHRAAVATAAVILVIGGAFGSAVLGLAYRRARANNERASQALRRSFAIADAFASDGMGRLESFDADPSSGLFYIGSLEYYEEIAKIFEGDPEMREMAAAAFYRVGFVQAVLRLVNRHPDYLAVDPAIAYRKAWDLYEAEIAARPFAPEPRSGLASALADFAAYQGLTSDPVDVELTCRRIIELRRSLIAEPDGRLRLAYDLTRQGHVLALLGRCDRAEDAIQESETLWTACEEEAKRGKAEERYEVARVGNQIALILGDFDGERAERILQAARDLDPDDPSLLNNEAWQLVKRPGATESEVGRAIDLARRALGRSPTRWELWNTFGIAQIRAGDPRGGADSLQRGMALRAGGDAHDWLPLAVAFHMMGDHAHSRARYDQALKWISEHPSELDLDLIFLRGEAAELLTPSESGRPATSENQ